MRLRNILDDKPKTRKRRWVVTLVATPLGAALIGLLSSNALADDEGTDVEVVKRVLTQGDMRAFVPPPMPKSCPGLNKSVFETSTVEVRSGERVEQIHTMTVGKVDIEFDKTSDGRTENIRVVESSHPCFEENAKAAIEQWRIAPSLQLITTQPLGEHANDVPITIAFTVKAKRKEDLLPTLNRLMQ